METTDNTLKEMQQQMQLLKDKLDKQKIVNDKMLRYAANKGINNLRIKSRIPYIAGVAAMLCVPSFYNLGCSLYFVIYSELMMLFCIGATIYTNSHIPNMEGNLVTAASQLTRFKKINAEWLKIGIPLLTVWVSWLIVDMIRGAEMSTYEMLAMFAGIGVGLVIGLALGLKVRRDVMNGADELIGQIKELQGM